MKKLSMLAILLLLLAACGASKNNGQGGAATQATAVEAIDTSEQPTQSGDEDVVEGVSQDSSLDLGLPFEMFPAVDYFGSVFGSAIGEWQCQQTDAQGDLNDADDDGIAENATYKYECSKDFAFGMSPVKVTRKGTITAQDKDDSDPYSGYKMGEKVVYSYSIMGVGGVSVTREFQRDWSGNAHSGYTFTHSHSWSWTSPVSSDVNKVERSYSGRYTPDSADHPFDQGQLVSDGAVKHYLNGVEKDVVSVHSDLHVNSSCQPAADNGTITFKVGNTTTKTVEFTGCGQVSANRVSTIEALEVSEQPAQNSSEETTEEASQDASVSLPFSLIPDFIGDIVKAPDSTWDCSGSSASGDTSDNDGDGVPVDASYDIQCSKAFDNLPGVSGEALVQRSGTLKLADKDDNDPYSGFKAEKDITYSYTQAGQTYTAEHSFKRDWSKSGNGYTFNHENAWSWDANKITSATSGDYTPDDLDSPFEAGNLTSDSTVKYLLNNVQQNLVEVSANLHVNSQCTPPADSGSVTFSVTGVDKTVNINSCQHQ